jgi:ribosomal protein L37AE/L43A
MGTFPECPYCGGASHSVEFDQASRVTIWECDDCASEFGEEHDGALVYVLDFDEPIRHGSTLY